MSTGMIIAMVVAFLALDAVVVGAIIVSVRQSLRPLNDAFPPEAPLPSAVTRRFQGFSLGMANLGWSVHVAADERHLHLTPTVMASLIGLRAVSIPWERIKLTRRGRWFSKAEIAGLTVTGPSWCMSLAEPGPATQAGDSDRQTNAR